jgi:hypothetical protein
MRRLLKEVIKALYYYLKDTKLREFYRIYDKFGKYERYKMVKC